MPESDDARPDWRDFSACHGQDPAIWYPEMGHSSDPAKAICHTCPVEDICLEAALARRERYGVWGGASETDRRRILRSRDRYHPEMVRKARPRKKAG